MKIEEKIKKLERLEGILDLMNNGVISSWYRLDLEKDIKNLEKEIQVDINLKFIEIHDKLNNNLSDKSYI